MKWLKNSLKGTGTASLSASNPEATKQVAAQRMYKSILRPRNNDLMTKLKKIPSKGLKAKLLKSIVKKADRYSDIVLKAYLKKWHDLIRHLRLSDFKNKLLGNFLFKTAKKFTQNNLRQHFNKWRNVKYQGKNLYPFENGIELLKTHCKRRAYAQVMPLEGSKGLNSKLLSMLRRHDDKLRKVPLRHYFNKWKGVLTKARNINLCAKFVCAIGNKVLSKYIIRTLSRRFQDWRRKARIETYVETARNSDTTQRKYYALVKLMSTHKLAKRVGLHTALPQVTKYLDNIIQQNATKRILFLHPKLNRLLLRAYFNKYKDQLHKLKMRELRDNVFNLLLGKFGSTFRKNVAKRYFQKWWRNLPKKSRYQIFQRE